MYANYFISFMIIWLWATFLVASCIKLSMNNNQTSVKLNLILHFYYKTVFIQTFLTFVHHPNFLIIYILIIASIMTNTMACAMRHEAWIWYLPSHLVPSKSTSKYMHGCNSVRIAVADFFFSNWYYWELCFLELPSSLRSVSSRKNEHSSSIVI